MRNAENSQIAPFISKAKRRLNNLLAAGRASAVTISQETSPPESEFVQEWSRRDPVPELQTDPMFFGEVNSQETIVLDLRGTPTAPTAETPQAREQVVVTLADLYRSRHRRRTSHRAGKHAA